VRFAILLLRHRKTCNRTGFQPYSFTCDVAFIISSSPIQQHKMKYSKSLILLVAVVSFTLDILYQVVRMALSSTGVAGDIAHSFFLVIGFVGSYHLIRQKIQKTEQAPVNLLGRILLLIVALALLYGAVQVFSLVSFHIKGELVLPRDYTTIVVSSLISIGSGIVSIIVYLTISELILIKQRKNTRRNLFALSVLIGLNMLLVFFSSPQGYQLLPDYPLTGLLMGLLVVVMIVNSFRFSWIIFLTRKEKLTSLLLVFFGMVFAIVLSVRSMDGNAFHRVFTTYHPMIYAFVSSVFLFSAIYLGLGFVSILLHLPTAREFDRKKIEVSSLQNLSRLITRVMDFDELVATATQLAIDACEGNIAWLALVDNDRSVNSGDEMKTVILQPSLRNVTETTIRDLVLSDGSHLHTHALRSASPHVVQDFGADKAHAPIREMFPFIGSMAMVPLKSHIGTVGLLCVGKKNTYEFDKEILNVLTAFADLVTVALENSRLITESIAQARLKEELRVAKVMQQKLLPNLLPVSGTYEIAARSVPAYEVGGDYYDALEYSPDRLGFIVGDVSGKGVSAALYMAQVKGIFRSLGDHTSSPRELLLRMNSTLWQCMEKSSFVSVLYAVLDFRTGILRFARAGHCPLLYIRGGSAQYLRPNGMGLGLDPGERFSSTLQEEELQLQAGDIIVLYTDGITEARNMAGEEFQFSNLSDVVCSAQNDTAENILKKIMETVLNHAGTGAPEDDMTILVLRWNGSQVETLKPTRI
jgi:serine phosphatase RsbU (regulator of sigma subunit)